MDNVDLSQNQQPRVYAQTLIVFPLAVIATLIRFYARYRDRAGYWWDDWFLLAGSIFNTGQTAITFIVLHYGLGKHIETMAPSDMPGFIATYYAGQILYACVLVCIKLSVLAMYWRIFNPSPSFRYLYYGLNALTIAWFLATFFGCVLACHPVSMGWGDMSDPNGYCIDKKAFFLAVAAVNSFTDFSILAVPVFYVAKIQAPLTQKILATTAFVLGGFVCVATLIRISVLAGTNFADPDQSWLQTTFAIWTGVEVNLAIISACLPIFGTFFHRRRGSEIIPTDQSPTGTDKERPRSKSTPTLVDGRPGSVFAGTHKVSTDDTIDTPLELHQFWADNAHASRTTRDRLEMPSPASELPSAEPTLSREERRFPSRWLDNFTHAFRVNRLKDSEV